MEGLPEDLFLEYNNDTLQEVRKTFDLDKQDAMKNAVDILEEWIEKQQHFTKKHFDRRYLETTIIISKGSIERSKSRIDRACTLRTLMPHFFELQDLRLLHETDLKDIKQAILPKMTRHYERVFIMRNSGNKFEPTFMNSYARSLNNLSTYLRRNDYSVGYHLVIDYTDVNLTELASALTISSLQEIKAIVIDCCGFRLKALYLISTSKFIEIVVTILRQVFNPKIISRINVLKDKDELKNVVDVDVLPKEYGGKEKSLDELHEQWLEVITSKEHIEYMKDMNTACTNEALRQTDTFNEQYMGMPGTFRTISLD